VPNERVDLQNLDANSYIMRQYALSRGRAKRQANDRVRNAQTKGGPATARTMETEHVSPAGRPAKGRRRDPQRSRITNGSALLTGVDGRSAWVRRCKDIIEAHLSDLGGEDNTSAAERSIVRRASVLTVELERLEKRFALAGEANPEQLDLYQRTAANLRRLLESVGLERRSKDVTPPDPLDYAAGYEA
jgi:hypothetical protein